MRLLPPNNDQGWTPYAWLIYLPIFLVYPFLAGQSPVRWALTVAAIAVFLPLYFWAYWLYGRRMLMPILGMMAIGTAFAPINSGASVFFVYAAGIIGDIGEPGLAARYLFGLLAFLGTESWLLHLNPAFWIPGLVFTALIGGVDIHAAQQRRMHRKLRAAYDDIEQLAKVAERERIARDLHDLLGHTLSVIVLKSELASKLADKDPARAITEIRDVERISRDALREVREAVKGYRSTGIEAELRNAGQTLRTAGLQVDFSVARVALTPVQESALVLALREAVTNVVRHAAANTCRIRLWSDASTCELEIADNGAGGAAPEGSGLSGMRQRIETLGGTLHRHGDRGTKLVIRIPIANVRSIGAA